MTKEEEILFLKQKLAVVEAELAKQKKISKKLFDKLHYARMRAYGIEEM